MKELNREQSLFDVMIRERLNELLNPTRNPRFTLPLQYGMVGEIVLEGFSKAGVEGSLGDVNRNYELPINLKGFSPEEFLIAVALIDTQRALAEKEQHTSMRFKNYRSTLVDIAEKYAQTLLEKSHAR